jgi:hypothetical protein
VCFVEGFAALGCITRRAIMLSEKLDSIIRISCETMIGEERMQD